MPNKTKEHWEAVYQNKQPHEVSWTQVHPKTSLDLIKATHLDKSAKIIDIGGGDSHLVDFLLEEGYQNISVLDISAKALERAQKRLGKNAEKVNWIVSNITQFDTNTTFDIWHDRAAFHFLTTPEEIRNYTETVNKLVSSYLIIGVFSENGPKKCSGLDIHQYSETGLEDQFTNDFQKIKCFTEDHETPFETKQNFLFCSFKRKKLK